MSFEGVGQGTPLKKKLFSFSFGCLLLILWYKYFLPPDVWQKLAKLQIGWLLFASIIFLLSFTCRAYRWGLIIKPLKKLPWAKLWRIYFAGAWINYVFPFSVEGEVLKTYYLKKQENLPSAMTLSTIFAERFYAFSALIVSLVFLPLFSFHFHRFTAIALAIVGIIYLLMLFFMFFLSQRQDKLANFISPLVFFLPQATQNRLNSLTTTFVNSLALVRQEGWAVLGVVAVSFLIAGLDALNLYALFQTVGLSLPFTTCYFGSCLLNLFYSLPAPPASIGTNEMYGTLIFVFGFGVAADLAPLAIVTGHIINGLIVALAGTLGLIFLHAPAHAEIGKESIERKDLRENLF